MGMPRRRTPLGGHHAAGMLREPVPHPSDRVPISGAASDEDWMAVVRVCSQQHHTRVTGALPVRTRQPQVGLAENPWLRAVSAPLLAPPRPGTARPIPYNGLWSLDPGRLRETGPLIPFEMAWITSLVRWGLLSLTTELIPAIPVALVARGSHRSHPLRPPAVSNVIAVLDSPSAPLCSQAVGSARFGRALAPRRCYSWWRRWA